MTFRQWASESKTRIREDGARGATRSLYELGIGGVRRFEPFLGIGTPVWEDEWDVLLILDACRYDLFTEIVDEYDFLEDDSRRSIGGGSPAWIRRTFSDEYSEEARETVYVTGNVFSDELVDSSLFRSLEEVWEYAWDDELNTVPARAMTDVAITEHRRLDPARMIVHYMQPHYPFVPAFRNGTHATSGDANTIWEAVRQGEVDRDTVWEQYRNNLRYVLDDVELLLRSIDADTVAISADHGNCLGEYGFYGRGDVPFPAVRRVPWSETTAVDDGEYTPSTNRREVSQEVEDKLEHLGYV